MALFSIVTIAFNSEKTIERTLKSVLAQTYKDYEYIIVDGASRDSTIDIVRKYEPLFEGRMKWKSEPDNGIYNAMNKGIMRSSGEIIGIVNSDDWLEEDALESVYSSLMKNDHNLDTIYCGSINYHWNSNIKRLNVDIDKFEHHASKYIMAGIRHPGAFVPKKVYNYVGLFDDEMKIAADQDFILRCFYSKVRFVNVNHVLSNMSDGGVSTDNSSKSRQNAINDYKRMLRKFNVKGFSYIWLFYSGVLRGILRRIAISCGLYKVS